MLRALDLNDTVLNDKHQSVASSGDGVWGDVDTSGLMISGNIKAAVPCFTPGTMIATPTGERRVEGLHVGDRVITRDNGIQEIRWIGQHDISDVDLKQAEHLKPVLIRQGALGNDLPERDMLISPNQRVLVASDETGPYFEERETLIAAKQLIGLDGVGIVEASNMTCIYVMFNLQEVILSDGVWTESVSSRDMSVTEADAGEGIERHRSKCHSLKNHVTTKWDRHPPNLFGPVT